MATLDRIKKFAFRRWAASSNVPFGSIEQAAGLFEEAQREYQRRGVRRRTAPAVGLARVALANNDRQLARRHFDTVRAGGLPLCTADDRVVLRDALKKFSEREAEELCPGCRASGTGLPVDVNRCQNGEWLPSESSEGQGVLVFSLPNWSAERCV